MAEVILGAGCDDFLCKPYKEPDVFGMMTGHPGVRFAYDETPDTKREKSAVINSEAIARDI